LSWPILAFSEELSVQNISPPQPVSSIRNYHAHIYYDGPEERAAAELLRQRIAERFSVLIGRWHDQLVGPHSRAMYQVAIPAAEFSRIVPWLMINRCGLTILIHPNTGSPKQDHLSNAMWLGEILSIDSESLPEQETKPEPEIVPNTQPTTSP
jgi:aromatic ring-cleaving dioxygenase